MPWRWPRIQRRRSSRSNIRSTKPARTTFSKRIGCFAAALSERDELLTADGKTLNPAAIHIFLGHRNRYAIEALAPRPEAYTFRYIATVRDGHHVDEVFATTPRSPSDVRIDQVTIDGVTALPDMIRFSTTVHAGHGSVAFGRVQKYWMATAATARATVGKSPTIEHVAFYRYRFPVSLGASTFSKRARCRRSPRPRSSGVAGGGRAGGKFVADLE